MTDMTYKRGNEIRQKRLDLNLTQRQVADMLGLLERSYWNIENGKRNIREWELIGILTYMEREAYNV